MERAKNRTAKLSPKAYTAREKRNDMEVSLMSHISEINRFWVLSRHAQMRYAEMIDMNDGPAWDSNPWTFACWDNYFNKCTYSAIA